MLQLLRWKSKNIFIHSEERGVINLVLGILESLVVLVAKVIEVEMTWEPKYNCVSLHFVLIMTQFEAVMPPILFWCHFLLY